MKYLTRPEASDYLTSIGFPISKATLGKYATVGGGPIYQKFGNRALYMEENLLEWANNKLSRPLRSTSVDSE